MSVNYFFDYLEQSLLADARFDAECFASISYAGTRVPLMLPQKPQQTFTIQKESIELEFSMKVYSEYHAVEWLTQIRNLTDEPTEVVSDLSVLDLTIPIPAGAEVVHRGITGDMCGEESFLKFSNQIRSGMSVSCQPEGGKSSNVAFPFFDLCGQTDGLICAIGWSGTWYYTIKRTERELNLKAGLSNAEFYMKPHESLRLPRILLMGYADGYQTGHNRFRSLIREHYSPKPRFRNGVQMPICLQNFDRYKRNPDWLTEKGQMSEIDFAEKCQACDTYWFDAGWFQDIFPNGVGNYTFHAGFPNGFTALSDYAHKKGLRFMIWFEPERVSYGTEIEREHPEFLLKSTVEDAKEPRAARGRVFDMGNPAAVDWLTELISGFIEKYDIDIYRQDFNIFPDTFWEQNDEPGRRGIREIKFMEGEYRFLDTLLERFPQLLIDNCASGGRKIDLETCIRSVFCWRSDTGCSPETEANKHSTWNQNQTLALSDYVVYHAIAAWEPRAYEVRSAMTNGFAATFDVRDEGFDFEQAGKALAECRRLRSYYEQDFYALIDGDLSEDHWCAWQFGTQRSGVMMAFRREQALNEACTIALQGLSEDCNYLLKITDEDYHTTETVLSGRELSAGVTFHITGKKNSLSVEYIRQ